MVILLYEKSESSERWLRNFFGKLTKIKSFDPTSLDFIEIFEFLGQTCPSSTNLFEENVYLAGFNVFV